MFSKSLAIGALAAGCVAAAAGGAYVSVQHNAPSEPVPIAASASPADTAASTVPADAPKAVAETEAVVSSPAATPKTDVVVPSKPTTDSNPMSASTPTREPREAVKATPERHTRPATPTAKRSADRVATSAPAVRTQKPTPSEAAPATAHEPRVPAFEPQVSTSAPPVLPPKPDVEPQAPQAPVETAPAPRQIEPLVVPASSVIGLRVETPLSTERAQVEDRVEARVTRDVLVDGRVAIPSGARAMGSVILVERGGKMKDRARLGVRFHTLTLSDGSELPINTEAIYREGDSPSGESARKIGGAAVGGAILGALIGGKKGAVIGGATGAAGGTAVVVAGDRNAATLPAGTIVTIRLAAPAGVEVEKH
jgi:hypothetical protein